MIKRDDLIHPEVMGNKWRKLKYNIEEALQSHKAGLVTFGGAYSNHLAATAAACAEAQLKSIGYVRGDELSSDSNHTLRLAKKNGMQLKFIPRSEYQLLKEHSQNIEERHPDYLVIPEGGTNVLALKGCAEIIDEITQDYDFLCTSMGTAGTSMGLLQGMKGQGQLLIFPALKGDWIASFIENQLEKYRISYRNYHLTDAYHFGGYGKVTNELISFVNGFKSQTGISLDPIYTGKMVFGIMDLVKKDFFPKGSRIIILHTGGLQGIIGYNEKQGKNVLL